MQFPSVSDAIRSLGTAKPIYCIFPDVYEANARNFVSGFPGRVLYAVKANAHPEVVRSIYRGGVSSFDCASLAEIETVMTACPQATCFFMNPARLRGAAADAQSRFGLRHFMVDHLSGIGPLAEEIDTSSSVVFARMSVSHPSAMQDLSSKFGAPPEEIPAILQGIADTGAEPALAFNVGTGVTSPDAYRQAIDVARRALDSWVASIRMLDIGGGFAKPYPGFDVPPLRDYFDAIRTAAAPLAGADIEILAEPGRALAAPGMSAVVEVLLRKGDRLYLNDGMYGIFWELRFKGHDRYAVRVYRNGVALSGALQPFRLYGPTCDSTDELPGAIDLPSDIKPGDQLEFGSVGAYSVSGRTDFNGFYSDQVVSIDSGQPPGLAEN